MRDRLGRLLLPVEHDRIVVARAGKAGRQLETARQHRLGVAIAAKSRAELGQHAQSGDIGRIALQMFAQQVFGDGEAIIA